MALFKKKKPHSDDSEDVCRILNCDTPFAIVEAFKALTTNVLYLPIEDKSKKICVTSSFSGEGKTYVSLNLAISLAENADAKKVLLIDADMRKPRVARLLYDFCNVKNKVNGLSVYLASISDEPNFIKSKNDNLFVLFSGATTSNPSGLINSSRMDKLLKIASEQFDYIIIDSPPVGVVVDALQLASKIDGYLIAQRANYSDVRSLADTVEQINNVHGEIFGIVISATDPKNSKGKGNYRYSYNYQTYN
jgi:capsular exopolysaccharide synthesis family protein